MAESIIRLIVCVCGYGCLPSLSEEKKRGVEELRRTAATRGVLVTDLIECMTHDKSTNFFRDLEDIQLVQLTKPLFDGTTANFSTEWMSEGVRNVEPNQPALADYTANFLRRGWHRSILNDAHPHIPKRLWHIPSQRSVEWSSHRPSHNYQYTAISYTWGRWTRDSAGQRLPSVRIPGLAWPIQTNTQFSISELLNFIKFNVQTEYAWVDVLCINQDDEAERQSEINKQAGTFFGAFRVLAWLWNVPNALPLKNIASTISGILWAENTSLQRPTGVQPFGIPAGAWDVLEGDPLFSSTWTLQEAVLAPGTVLVARNGTCAVYKNGTLLSIGILTILFRVYTFISGMAHRFQSDRARQGLTNTIKAPLIVDSPAQPYSGTHDQTRFGMTSSQSFESFQLWWKLEVGMAILENQSRSDAIRAASVRFYREGRSRAPAVMSAIGCYEWQNQPQTPLIDGFPVCFLEEAKNKEGPTFFCSSPTVAIGRTFKYSMLPMKKTYGAYTIPPILDKVSADVSDWKINNDGSVTVPSGVACYSNFSSYGFGIQIFSIRHFINSSTGYPEPKFEQSAIINRQDWEIFSQFSRPATNIRFIPLVKISLDKRVKKVDRACRTIPPSDEFGIVIGQNLVAPDVWSKFGVFQWPSYSGRGRTKKTEVSIVVS